MLRVVDDLRSIPGGRKVISASEYELICEGQRLLHLAREEAQRLKNESTVAFEMQKAAGYQKGLLQGSEEIARRIVQLDLEISEFKRQLRMDVAELVMSGVRTVLDDFSNSDLVSRISSQLVAEFHSEKSLRLRVHSSAIGLVTENVSRLRESYPSAIELQIVGDDQLETTGCVLESSTGIVDGSVETQLELLGKALRDALRDAETGGANRT
ncbi:MAG: hypothetical protein RLZZ436_4214 [Planctomycetota bacterium]|jgi:type III secretion system HrpE/YscL family protein